MRQAFTSCLLWLAPMPPRGKRPELLFMQSHDHLGVIGGITPQGALYSLTQRRSLTGLDCAKFLAHLLQEIDGPILALSDRIGIHRSLEVREYLSALPPGLIQLEELPVCAPELNPQEGIWHLLKSGELKNVCCDNLDQLSHEVWLAIRRLRAHPDAILSCFEGAGLIL